MLGLLLLYMLAGGALAARLIAGRATERLGRPVTIGSGHGGLGAIVLDDVVDRGRARPAAAADRQGGADSAGASRWGCAAPVRVDGLRDRGREGRRRRTTSARSSSGCAARKPRQGRRPAKRPTARSGGGSSSSVPDVVITNGALEARDDGKHLAVKIASFDAELRPGTKLAVRLRGVHGELALGDGGPGARASPPTRSTCRRRSPGCGPRACRRCA